MYSSLRRSSSLVRRSKSLRKREPGSLTLTSIKDIWKYVLIRIDRCQCTLSSLIYLSALQLSILVMIIIISKFKSVSIQCKELYYMFVVMSLYNYNPLCSR